MNLPRVVHCKREAFDVYIGRPRPWEGLIGDWGNPFSHKDNSSAQYKVATVEEAVEKYEAWLLSQPELVARVRRELRGKVLGCWGCVPCHGDVLVRVANADVVNCRLCGVQIIWGPSAAPEQRAAGICIGPCMEKEFDYSCMYKGCGRIHRFSRVEDLRFACEHAATAGLKPAVGTRHAFCIRCGAEMVLGGGYEERQQPLCDVCTPTAPAFGWYDHVAQKHDFIIGLDEVGWGALAGPLMVGAAIVPRGWRWPGLRDSKNMSAAQRERLIAELEARAVGRIFVHVERMEVREFEQLGAENALLETHRRAAVRALDWTREHFNEDRPLVIIDGKKPIPGIRCQTQVNADDVVPAVMIAAIVAKAQRDHYMTWLHQFYPDYKFDQNAGYGEEQAALVKKLGGCEAHRRNYNPLKKMLAGAPKRRMQQLPLFEET